MASYLGDTKYHTTQYRLVAYVISRCYYHISYNG